MATDDNVVDTLRRRLPPPVKRDLARAKPLMSGWTAKVADRVLQTA